MRVCKTGLLSKVVAAACTPSFEMQKIFNLKIWIFITSLVGNHFVTVNILRKKAANTYISNFNVLNTITPNILLWRVNIVCVHS
jgi:hypothetical protein